ncbi:UDP-glycosyltransferase 708G1 [Cannabis sativa]|uniref:Glycosyltransferase n=1 Tax=Cannabis sativa TaxID=3483 RepID=A0A7J6H6A3_CANSA|nr:UDP-glycosyltransferase 708G1 [Cannabis sativa]KAF4376745.1 hypothetical protein F8388_025616 [Cannabis sativa]KAF4390822.1 hypothetical protein G4B88_015712 [Cannabis sativa]
MSTSNLNPHIALLPSAGMGHLTPFIRLIPLLTSHNVKITVITPHPTLSISESESLSELFTSFPQVTRKQLHLPLPPLDDEPSSKSQDPFYNRFEVIRRSSHLLLPLLSSLSPPLSALITDMSLASTVIPITNSLQLPNYIFFTSSAKMLSLFLSFHALDDPKAKDFIEISGFEPIPKSWIPPPLLDDANNAMKIYFTECGKKMKESSGILVNTYESIEGESLKAFNSLPPVIAIGPLPPIKFERNQSLAWLDDQPAESVLYVSFGSRTAISREQIKALADGLVKSGKRFLWVVKDKKVDRDDETELVDLIGEELMERVKEKGMVVKNWLNQEEVLSHPAVGWFLSHCGWNSLTEAIWHGVPMLLWPQHGDQKINADLVERIGVGMWAKSWGWGDSVVVVKGDEIADTVREMTGNEFFRLRAAQVQDDARKAFGEGGSSYDRLNDLVDSWKCSPDL